MSTEYDRHLAAIGGLSDPSKMPCYSYSIPAYRCRLGAKLRKLNGTVCHDCYAEKGCYVFASTRAAMARRLAIVDAMLADPAARAAWIGSFAYVLNTLRTRTDRMIRRTGKPGARDGRYFRWHDSGDLQSVEHLHSIVSVVDATPTVEHWLPTREVGDILAYLRAGYTFPSNLTVRVSLARVGDAVPPSLESLARVPRVSLSGVHADAPTVGFAACHAPAQAGECRDCRACWTPSVRVSYHLH